MSKRTPPVGGPVGYGQPPEWTRFRKGQSGNPKGRPTKQQQAERQAAKQVSAPHVLACDDRSLALQRAVLDRKVRIGIGGRLRMVTVEEANLHGFVAAAIKGNGPAQRELAKMAERLGAREAKAAARARQTAREDFDRAVSWKASLQTIWALAEARGTEPDGFWVHPDDVFLDEDNLSCRIRGPFDASELPRFEYLRAERDFYLIAGILEMHGTKANGQDWFDMSAMVCKRFDILLPLRWQIAPMDDDAAHELACLTVEELRRRQEDAGKTAARLLPMTPYARPNRAVDAFANRIARPLLDQYGYRTLKAFTAAIAENDGKPLLPKGPPPD